MERILLVVLCLSGCSISSCLPRQFHYVADSLSWTEAQTYCRQTYTDLATIESLEEMKRVNKTVLLSGLNSEVWIGLYRQMYWKWSDNYTGSGAEYRKWRTGQPDDWQGKEHCVSTGHDGFNDASCSDMISFVCYRGSQKKPEFVLVNEQLNWPSAQRHCREKYKDLATVKSDAVFQKIIGLKPIGQWRWIGLHKESHDFWSDGSSSKFRYWDNVADVSLLLRSWCVVADLESSGKWRLLPCERRFPFVCYSVPQTGIKRQVIKLRMKPDDPSLDLNDPVVKADILKKLQNRLKENGLNGVTLKWREQPDGKVFHKEGGSSQEKKREKTEL